MLLLVEVFLKYDRFPFLKWKSIFSGNISTYYNLRKSSIIIIIIIIFFFANFNSPLQLCCKFSLLKSFEEMFLVLTNSKFI